MAVTLFPYRASDTPLLWAPRNGASVCHSGFNMCHSVTRSKLFLLLEPPFHQ